MLVLNTKRVILIAALVLSGQMLFAADKTDSVKQATDVTLNNVDSLKKLQPVVADSLKGRLYTAIADQYLKYDNITNERIKLEYQEAALRNTYLALHFYSRYADTLGLVTSFNVLAKVYHAQKKYPQAKWFILQSNTMSRAINDNNGIINSLITLASIKSDIKDYTLAMRDLNEALSLSSKTSPQLESQVELAYAMLYNDMRNPAKAEISMKRHLAIDDSIKKTEELALLAKQKSIDSADQAKKKEYLTSSNNPYTTSSSRKADTLQYLSLSLF
jgi:hypothetical protein